MSSLKDLKRFLTLYPDKLYTKQYPDDLEKLPSPESLKHKVLIKVRWCRANLVPCDISYQEN